MTIFPLVYTGIITWFVPCYTFGKNAETVGESCVMYGLSMIVPLLNIWCMTSIRGRIREQKGIEGTCTKDLLLVLCCPLCTLVQEARVSPFAVTAPVCPCCVLGQKIKKKNHSFSGFLF